MAPRWGPISCQVLTLTSRVKAFMYSNAARCVTYGHGGPNRCIGVQLPPIVPLARLVLNRSAQ
jgi:hypothetical protein